MKSHLILLGASFFLWGISRGAKAELPGPAPFCAQAVVVLGGPIKANNKPIQVGQGLVQGSRVQTGKNSFLKLSLKDGSVLDIGPSSVLVLTQCGERPRNPDFDLELELGSVRLNVVSEKKVTRKGFKLRTPTSVLGVRGTEFFVSWKKDASGLISEQVGVSEGQIEVKSVFDQQARPLSLDTGMEFRAQARMKSESNGPQIEVVTPPQVDQFSAKEQKEFEQNTKIEQRPFEEAVQIESGEKQAGNQSQDSKVESFIVAKITQRTQQPPRQPSSEPAQAEKTKARPNFGGGLAGNEFTNSNPVNNLGTIPIYTSALVVWQASMQDTK